MPLSEEELRLLEQMERALVDEDPKFANTLRGTAFGRSARRRAIVAGIAFATGVAVLMSGAIAAIPALGVVGFVIMLGSAYVAVTSLRRQDQKQDGEGGEGQAADGISGLSLIDGGRSPKKSGGFKRRRPAKPSGGGPASGSFMERMEARWRRRRENGGF